MIVALTWTGRVLEPLDPFDLDKLAVEYTPGEILSVDVKPAKKRSIEQNRLQRLWLKEAAEQLKDETIEEKRAYCKLTFGVPILCNEDEEFREAYDRLIGPHSYEDKLLMMALPIDFPVTRLMSKKQKTQYLDAMWQHFTSLGVRLTQPPQKW